MMRLSREIRFAVTDKYSPRITNSWAGWPSTNLVVPHLSLVTTVAGTPDEKSSYICNIKLLDELMRNVVKDQVVPKLKPNTNFESVLNAIFTCSLESWNWSNVTIVEQVLKVSPFLKFSMKSKDKNMVCLTQQFEFSASHRLHNAKLSDEENRELFGKCNNPNGHGHNYIVEVSLNRAANQGSINLPVFESKVKELVIERLDHKHLNIDVDYFATVNPSVENIAIAIWNWLDGQIEDAALANIRVYETPKTWADYSG